MKNFIKNITKVLKNIQKEVEEATYLAYRYESYYNRMSSTSDKK